MQSLENYHIDYAKRHGASGHGAMATSTSSHATLAALNVMDKGGNAIDAYIVAALVQCVVEHGSTSLGGAFALSFYKAASGKTQTLLGGVRGAREDDYEDYSYKSSDAFSGRGMAVPGYVDGIRAAHENGASMSWPSLFEWAIHFADEGFELTPNAYRMANKSDKACRFPEGMNIWMNNGRYLLPGERVRQPVLAKTLRNIAEFGPEYFYVGKFAENFVEKANSLGGKHNLTDMKKRLHSTAVTTDKLEGDYRGFQFIAPSNAMAVYAMHLNEAADISGMKSCSSLEAVYSKSRIAEEIMYSGNDYNAGSHEKFVSKKYAQERIDFVLNSPVRATSLDLLFKTNFLIVKDKEGNVAWQTHTINSIELFGAGIVVDGVYIASLVNPSHANCGDLSAGSSAGTCFALYREGKPAFIAGSPGFGWWHGPYQVMTSMCEFNLTPDEAVRAPRFGLGSAATLNDVIFEGHFPQEIFDKLPQRGISLMRISPSTLTGIVGAIKIHPDGLAYLAQDPRHDGLAMKL